MLAPHNLWFALLAMSMESQALELLRGIEVDVD
jgi:hypothetical protein